MTRKQDSYHRSESEVSKSSQHTSIESDSELVPNAVSEDDTAAFSGRSETLEDMNIPDISEYSVAEKAHYFEEQIQKEIYNVKVPHKLLEFINEKDNCKILGNRDQDLAILKSDELDLKLKLKLEVNLEETNTKNMIEKINTSNFYFLEGGENSMENIDKKNFKETKIPKRREKIFSKLDKEWISQSLIKGKKELKDKEEGEEKEKHNITVKDLNLVRDFESKSTIQNKILNEEGLEDTLNWEGGSQETIISETTNKNYLPHEVGHLCSFTPETYEVEKMERDMKGNNKVFDPEYFTDFIEAKTFKKSKIKLKMRNAYESKIPVLMSKTEKESILNVKENITENQRDITLKSDLKVSKNSPEVFDSEKKKESESRIPKQVHEKDRKKDSPIKKEYHFMEEKTNEEVTLTKRKTEYQIFSKTLTSHPYDTVKNVETMNEVKSEPEAAVKSIIDQETLTSREKSETSVLEILKGANKFFVEDKKENIESNIFSETIFKKESSDKMTVEKECQLKEFDITAFQKTLIHCTSKNQLVESFASQKVIKNKEIEKTKTLEDQMKIVSEVENAIKMTESKVAVDVKIKKDLHNLKKDIVKIAVDENFCKEELKYSDKKFIIKSETNQSYNKKITDCEGRNTAKAQIQTMENDIERRPITSDCFKTEFKKEKHGEFETSGNKLADDLTRKFENVMKKSICQDDIKAKPFIQKGVIEKDKTEDCISVCEEVTKDKESFPHDKKDLLFSRFHITVSSSSISDHIDIEDMEENILGSDKLKSRTSVESSELKDLDDVTGLTKIKLLQNVEDTEIPSLRESFAIDSLDKIYYSHDKGLPKSPSLESAKLNANFSLFSKFKPIESFAEGGMMSRKGDSFDIHSPPIISPRIKVTDLEIKPINWMIGDEKIEISETLQPSQAFDKELEEYQSSIKQQETHKVPQNSTGMDTETKSINKYKDLPFKCHEKETRNLSTLVKCKFTVTKISDGDLEKQLKKGKLEASCQELLEAVEKEQQAKDQTAVEKRLEPYENKNFIIVNLPDDSNKINFFKESEQENKHLFRDPYSNKKLSEIQGKIGTESESEGQIFLHNHENVIEKLAMAIIDQKELQLKKEDLNNVRINAQYAITDLNQVVKKEIDEIKESLEAAKQDLIEELSENSEVVFNIEDSPSEFQFKLQQELIPNELPFLYRASSLEKGSDQDSTPASDSPVIKLKSKYTSEDEDDESRDTESNDVVLCQKNKEISWNFKGENKATDIISDTNQIELQDDIQSPKNISLDETDSRSSILLSIELDNKDEIFSLQLPEPLARKRLKSAKIKNVISESEAESSGESNYQSCDYEMGSGSRPSSSDFDAMQSVMSGTVSEYETAMMSLENSRPTSQDYQTAANTLSSRESMKSLNSVSSEHLGSVGSTSELSETLVPSESEMDEKDVTDNNLEIILDDDQIETEFVSNNAFSNIISKKLATTLESDVPCRMKRSSEMIFPQLSKEESIYVDKNLEVLEVDIQFKKKTKKNMYQKSDINTKHELEEMIELPLKINQCFREGIQEYFEIQTDGINSSGSDASTSIKVSNVGVSKSVDIMTTEVKQDGIQNVSTQVISREFFRVTDDQKEQKMYFAPESLDQKLISASPSEENNLEQTSTRTWLQQASMSISSTSGLSVETVLEKDLESKNSSDSDSFELVDKPDITDDFVVIEEVGREAEEFDSEGKSIKISSIPCTSVKNYDRDVENLITEKKHDNEVSANQEPKNNELFEFESEESPPQASNTEQYSQSYSDEEQYEGGKNWIEMQFQSDTRIYDIEYERGPLEDIKEEEITDFEAGSSKFGSMGSHKESFGSIGSMRGSFGSTPDYDALIGKKYFIKPTDHDNISLSSLQEFEHLENAVAMENSKKFSSGSQDSGSNGSLSRRYNGRSGHGDDVSLSSLKDFEGLENACKEVHLIELRAKEEENLLDHESPENKFKLESITKAKTDASTTNSINQSNSGSDDYEKRIKEIDEIIRIAQANVEKLEKQDDTTEDISQIEIEKSKVEKAVETIQFAQETNVMETSTDSLELKNNIEGKCNQLWKSSDSLELKTTLDLPSLSSDSLNNIKDTRDTTLDVDDHYRTERRISSDSLDIPTNEFQELVQQLSSDSSNCPGRNVTDISLHQISSTTSTQKTKGSSDDGI